MDTVLDVIPPAWAALAGTIAFLMLGIKPGLKRYFIPLAAKVKLMATDEAEIKAAFAFIAAIVGVVLSYAVFPDSSFFAEFDHVPTQEWQEHLDHVILGVFCSLGQKAMADSWDWVKTLFGYFLEGRRTNA